MPLYEYECDACGAIFEVIQKFSDPPVEKCRACGGPVHKMPSAPAIQFKGSGWYVTDYARKNTADAKKRSEDASSSSQASESKSSAAAESKPSETTSSAATTTAKDKKD